MPHAVLAHLLQLADVTQVGSPPWLVVGWVFVGVGVVSFLVILADILRGYRQHMAVMNWVYPVTGLCWGAVAVHFYLRRGVPCRSDGRRSTTGTWSR